MTWDGDAEGAAKVGAERALAALSHDISTPLTALYTFLRLAKGEGLEPIRRCADRIAASVGLARELTELDDVTGVTNVSLAFESAAARVGTRIDVLATGDVTAQIATARVVISAMSLLRAVGEVPATVRITRERGRIITRLIGGNEPATWRVVQPWETGTGFKLDVWGAAVAVAPVGVVRVGDGGYELDLPAVELP